MQGVTFGTFHSFRAWGLMLTKMPIVSAPEPKYNLVEVPGSNVIIDLTESLAGKVTYRPRELVCEFVSAEHREKWAALHSEITNAIHGKRLQIVLDNDPDYYWLGRVTVGKIDPEKRMVKFMIMAMVEPYKYYRYGNEVKL